MQESDWWTMILLQLLNVKIFDLWGLLYGMKKY
jgi:hypothetical protein